MFMYGGKKCKFACVCVFDIIIRYPKKKKLHYEAVSENI